MYNTKKLATFVLSTALILTLSGCGSVKTTTPTKTAEPEQKSEKTAPVKAGTQKGGAYAINQAGIKAGENLEWYLKEYGRQNVAWYPLIKDVTVKFGSSNYVKVVVTAKADTEGIKAVTPIMPVLKEWAKTSSKAKFDSIEIVDQSGKSLLKDISQKVN